MKKFILFIAILVVFFVVGGLFFVSQRQTLSAAGALISAPVSVKLNKIPVSAEVIYHTESGYIYVMDRNGGNVKQINFKSISGLEHAAVSFDRRYIITNENHGSGPSLQKLWLFDLNKGTKARLLPNFYAAGQGGVDWDPQGFIYFAGQPTSGSAYDVYKIKPDGTGLTQLTHIIPAPTSAIASASDVGGSLDGSLVTYVGFAPKPFGDGYVAKTQIWVANSDGSNQRMVFDGGPELGMYSGFPIGAYDPEISDDNQSVVFSLVNTSVPKNFPAGAGLDTAHDLWRVNLDGTGLTRLTKPGPISIIPDWRENSVIYTELSGADNYKGASIITADGTDQLPTRIKSGAWMVKWIPKL